MGSSSMGYQSRISFAAGGTAIGSYTEAIEIVSETLKKRMTILATGGMRGTRSRPKERSRDGNYTVGGQVTLHPTPAVLDLVLPRILGANESTDTFALAETIPEFDILVDRVAKRFVYAGCKITKATFRGRAGGLIELVLDIVGKTESTSATAFPAISAPTDPPYVFYDGVLTLLSSAREFNEFELTIDNAVYVRTANSQTATDLKAMDRIITLTANTPYTSDELDLYGQNVSGSGAGTLVFTNGGYSTTFTMAHVQIPDDSPTVERREDEVRLKLSGNVLKSGSTAELVVTHDSAT